MPDTNQYRVSGNTTVIEFDFVVGDGRQGKWEATGHIVKLQDSSEEVTMELRDSQKIPVDTTTGTVVIIRLAAVIRVSCMRYTRTGQFLRFQSSVCSLILTVTLQGLQSTRTHSQACNSRS